MNRNVESHFAQLPSIDIQRSIFDRSSTHKTSFDAGELIPIYVDEVLPGDSFRLTSSKVIRAQTMLTPIMDNMYLDTYFFFVPMRLVWDHAKEFFGENTQSAWIPEVEYQIPSISSPLDSNSEPISFDGGTIADYMGIPTYWYDDDLNPIPAIWTNEAERRPSALPIRAYAKICDEWFRDENLTDPLNIPTGDSNQTGSNGSDYINDVANGGKPFKVAKYHDYFTSCLPSPQKGPDVGFTFGQQISVSPYVPVGVTNVYHNPVFEEDAKYGLALQNMNTGTLHDIMISGSSYNTNTITKDADTGEISGWYNATNTPANLYAKLEDAITVSGMSSFDINELRLAFQLQKFYEKQARGGSRYIEILKQHFGVTSPDARLQRTEYLGGNRIPLSIHEVTNSAQSQSDFLGDLGAKSATSDIHEDFERSFTEHGYIIGVCCVRYDHSYPQGLERFWSRRKFTDFYWPVFANIGEQPVYDSEIYADSTNMANGTVFGYQEAWADYRYKPDRVSGEMRPGIANTLASWHLSDYYTSKPTLSDGWIREDKNNVDRVLAVTSSVSNQFFADFYFECICTRAMPTYSIPGLIDHH